MEFSHLSDGACKYLLGESHGSCWMFVSDVTLTWSGAAKECMLYGGHLAVEYNTSIHEAILNKVDDFANDVNWWIGLRHTVNAAWTWTNQQALGNYYCVPGFLSLF